MEAPMLSEWVSSSTDTWLVAWGTLAIGAILIFVCVRLVQSRRDRAPLRRSRERPRLVRDVPVEYLPPRGLRPAELGMLVDGAIDERDIVGTVIDLAQRGYITIERTQGTMSDAMIRWTGKDWTDLCPYEMVLFTGLFSGQHDMPGAGIRMSAVAFRMPLVLEAVIRELSRSAMEAGWFVGLPRSYLDRFWAKFSTLRRRFAGKPFGDQVATGCVWVLLACFGVFALMLALVAWSSADHESRVSLVAVVVAGPLVTTLVIALPRLTRRLRRRIRYTPLGEDLRRRALGFRNLLVADQGDRMRFADRTGVVHEYLPYAVAFGIVEDKELVSAYEMGDALANWLKVGTPAVTVTREVVTEQRVVWNRTSSTGSPEAL